jgi:hypothetical protein
VLHCWDRGCGDEVEGALCLSTCLFAPLANSFVSPKLDVCWIGRTKAQGPHPALLHPLSLQMPLTRFAVQLHHCVSLSRMKNQPLRKVDTPHIQAIQCWQNSFSFAWLEKAGLTGS